MLVKLNHFVTYEYILGNFNIIQCVRFCLLQAQTKNLSFSILEINMEIRRFTIDKNGGLF
jgi:hypothetical protein